MSSDRVVVTGIGVISSIGTGRKDFWGNLIKGKSGISRIESFDTTGYPSSFGGEIKDFNPGEYAKTSKVFSNYGRASQFAVVAAKLAMEDAGIKNGGDNPVDIQVVVGTTMGETQAIESIDTAWVNDGEKDVPKKFIAQYPGNTLALSVANEINSNGLALVIPTACSAGNYAIGYGFDLIKTGEFSQVLVGGSDAFSRIAFAGFNRMYAMAPEKCCPFDKNRQGMLLGEGSAFLLIESLAEAQKNRRNIYAEVLGYGLSCDASHMTIPNEDGIVSVISKALAECSIATSQVDYISAHGTGTPMNDRTESRAINRVFGAATATIPISSIKSMLGHTMGAASAMEAIACVMSIYDNKIPPTINFQDRDDECGVDCVPNEYREKEVTIALNNSFAFGGNNACVVFARFKP